MFVALEYFEAHNVKFIDALIASGPSFVKGEFILVSYDHDFDKLGIQRIEPDKIPL